MIVYGNLVTTISNKCKTTVLKLCGRKLYLRDIFGWKVAANGLFHNQLKYFISIPVKTTANQVSVTPYTIWVAENSDDSVTLVI